MKNTYTTIVIIFLSLTSCGRNQDDKLVNDLRRENDSLKNLIDTLQTKFVFDDAMLASMPMLWKKHTNGDVAVHIGYAATNNDAKILFSRNADFTLADTLTSKNDFNVVVPKDVDTIYYKMLNQPKFGKEHDWLIKYPMKNYR